MTDKKRMILIVDDNPENRKVLGSLLVKNGFEVGVAKDGHKALEFLQKVKPALILLDIMMPGMDGYETCLKIKESTETKHIPVIFLTAKTEAEDIVKGFDSGGVDYVSKPFNISELLARVNTQIALIKAGETLEALHKKEAIGAMAITANHEINQPLQVAKGSLEMLTKYTNLSSLSEKQRNLISKTISSLESIEKLVKRYADSNEFKFVEYSKGVNMVKFKDDE